MSHYFIIINFLKGGHYGDQEESSKEESSKESSEESSKEKEIAFHDSCPAVH
jgi:hypothetical protein